MNRSRSALLRLVAVLAALGTAGTALAQSAACQRYQAELAAFDRGGGRESAAAARNQRAEISRLADYYRSIGCEGGRFLFFGSPPPPECGGIAQRLRAMQANYARLAAESDYGDREARRRQLLAAVEQTCDPRGGGSFLERLFGGGGARPAPEEMPVPTEAGPEPGAGRLGGGRAVCVRTCDGYFFPLANRPADGANPNEMCQALCPNAETSLYFMPNGGDIERAVSANGQPYTSLPNASRYKKAVVPSCSCRAENQSWVQALSNAEQMLAQHNGDILVTAEKSEEMSHPKPDPKAQAKDKAAKAKEAKADKDRADKARRAQEARQDEADADAAQDAAVPTASQDSAGIGPKSIEGPRVLGRGDGARVRSGSGNRSVRVLPPTEAPLSDAGTAD